jgi:hypothetical protein
MRWSDQSCRFHMGIAVLLPIVRRPSLSHGALRFRGHLEADPDAVPEKPQNRAIRRTIGNVSDEPIRAMRQLAAGHCSRNARRLAVSN